MQKLLITALLCTLSALTLSACPGEDFQAATGMAVDMPSAKTYRQPADITSGADLNYEEDLGTSDQDNTDMNMDMDDDLDVSDMNVDDMTQGGMDME
jgi:hypothetical protein